MMVRIDSSFLYHKFMITIITKLAGYKRLVLEIVV